MYKWITGLVMGSCSIAYANGQPATPASWIFNPTGVANGTTAATYVFSPTASISDINNVANQIYALNGGTASSSACSQQFTNGRFAILFQPGSYTGTYINVGYYTSVAGLGADPTQTLLGDVTSPQNCGPAIDPGALNAFWRSAENFTTTPTIQPLGNGATGDNIMVWATSQACPIRGVNVEGELWLFQLGTGYASTYCSGGFMADTTVTSPTGIILGGQQQFFVRNSDGALPSDGVWNYVYVGCPDAPVVQCPALPLITNIAATPVIAEKPFISYISGASGYALNIPQRQTNKSGTSQDDPPTITSVPFTYVYVTTPADTAETINAQIQAGNHILLSPGIYSLEGSIELNQADTCLIGIGFPTLIASNGEPCIVVTGDHVRVGGLILQAGPNPTSSLLQWGTPGDSITEGYLYDCFTRIGRFDADNQTFNQVNTSVQINSNNIVCDNLWLWRADHDAINTGDTPSTGVNYGNNPSINGLIVGQGGTAQYGKNTIIYGLASEHHLQDLVQWHGDNGICYFFQAEFPYDAGATYASDGYAAYRVGSQITAHDGWGLGAYSNFYNTGVVVGIPFVMPVYNAQSTLNNVFTRYLNSQGGITFVVNNQGQAVNASGPGPYPVCQNSTVSLRTSPTIRVVSQ